MSSSVANGLAEEISLLHQRLDARFTSLHQRRAAGEISTPIFALEHELSSVELRLLKAHVRSAIHQGHLSRTSPLPFVVYATELGYEYSGDEYWQTFSAQTPGWHEHGDREYIRNQFQIFQDRYGGAEPTGAWARHFSIICWPITHAVLPTDLQRHLARLLFEYRYGLTAELLADPDALGVQLAARALHASGRFQNFAQNTSLLGQVAAALLSGEEEPSRYLSKPTLHRIVEDLSKARDARSWLRGAKSAATSVRARGFRRSQRPPSEGGSEADLGKAPSPTDPTIWLRKEGTKWVAYAELPDLSSLVERLPELGEQLRLRRTKCAGVAGAPLARGLVLYPNQQVRLSEWPPHETAFLQLEDGSDAANALLADQCVLSPGPVWLFNELDTNRAPEVRGKFVRPGHRYVLLSREPLSAPTPPWVKRTEVGVAHVAAYALECPPLFETDQVDAIRGLGLGVATDVSIRPAGLVPAAWDGEGQAAWLAGESPMLAIASNRAVTYCILALNGEEVVLAWPQDEERIYVCLRGLGVGSHSLRVSLVTSDQESLTEGSFALQMRTPQARSPSGSLREGLVMLATPVSPTLTELWDGSASLEVRGPQKDLVHVEFRLESGKGETLATQKTEAPLPIGPREWEQLFEREVRGSKPIQMAYDDSEVCAVSIRHVRLGRLSIRCEREFVPLRWTAGRTREGPFLRLINNTEGVDLELRLYEFAQPDRSVAIPREEAQELRSSAGGLVTALAAGNSASIVLPPLVRDLQDLTLRPRISDHRPRSLRGVLGLIGLASEWATASRPSDPVGETNRIKVLRAVTASLCSLVGGEHWAMVERRLARPELELDRDSLQEAVGRKPYQRALARDVGRWVDRFRDLPLEERVESFAAGLAVHARREQFRSDDPAFAEFLLRFASEPATLSSWPFSDRRILIERTLAAPMLLRAARFLVLAIDSVETYGPNATFGGWAWQ